VGTIYQDAVEKRLSQRQRVGWWPRGPRRSRSGCRLYRCRLLNHAKAVVRTIVTLTKTLARFPRSGCKVPEFADQNTRELIAYSYRIICTIEPDQVIIAALIPGKTNALSLRLLIPTASTVIASSIPITTANHHLLALCAL
jgi:plasmid stabilization system protein ParE